MPALMDDAPMRGSNEMPSVTSSIDAPTLSQRDAISLMKDILVARKALLAYFIISALVISVTMNGASMPLCRDLTTCAAAASSVPTTIRSG